MGTKVDIFQVSKLNFFFN